MRKGALVLLLVAILSAGFGVISLASNSDKVTVNGVEVGLNDEIEVTVSIDKYDNLLSGFVGKVAYDKTVLEVKEVYDADESLTYNQNESSVKFAVAEAVEGITVPEKKDLMKIKFEVISSEKKSTSVEYITESIYDLDKENKQDIENDSIANLISIGVKASGNSNSADGNVNDNSSPDGSVENDELDDVVQTGDKENVIVMIAFCIASFCGVASGIMYKKSNSVY